MKVGLLGGSFNPGHQGHVYISEIAIKKLKLNQVWWIPTAQNPFKEKSIYESYEKRVENCLALTSLNPKIRVKKIDEIYTEKLVSRLRKKYPNIEFFWLMGADNLEKFHQWKNFKKLIHEIPFVIFSRENFLKKIRRIRIWKLIFLTKSRFFYIKNCDISSSKIRKNYHV